MPRAIILALGLLTAAPSATAANDVLRASLDEPGAIGSATLRWFGFPLYEGTLYTPGGAPFDWSRPMALELRYLRGFDSQDLTTATRSELERIEGAQLDHDAILTKIAPCYRDVASGDRITAVASDPETMTFWFNDAQTCAVSHPGIVKRYLSIWLSDQSRLAQLSRRLRGE